MAELSEIAKLAADHKENVFIIVQVFDRGRHPACPRGRPTENPSHDERGFSPKLKDLGVSKASSSRWQSVASLPEDQFESYIAQAKEGEAELTLKGVQTFAKVPAEMA
jgi:hypothetical protein